LKVGPQPPAKPQEPAEEQQEEEKAPLVDARKGRARGPARRKPASSSGVSAVSPSSAPTLEINEPRTVWSTSRDRKNIIVGFPGKTSTDADVEAAEESSTGAGASVGVEAELSSTSEADSANEPEAVPSVGTIDHASEDIAQVSLPEVQPAAAPETSEADGADEDDEADYATSELVHQSVQTGEKTIVMSSLEGEPIRLTVTEGGKAQEEGHVVQKEEGSG